ncbi:MAG TPA: hypothetical protein P5230_02185 [Candidatus Magasanikbacteria bacterium]|nr:hypothetical protein [Candidatus Magasanikbacteria bacterium]
MTNYTIQLFQYFYQNIPPLFPLEEKEKIKNALKEMETNQSLTPVQIENTMISFGYVLWPWNQAYKEFLTIAENAYGDEFLLPYLSKEMQKKYLNYKDYGLSLRDLHSGRPAVFFESEERVELYRALLKMQEDLKKFVNQQIASTEKERFIKKVEEYAKILENIEEKLRGLREIAQNEQDHPILADEIRERIRMFEFGMCLLGPELNFHAVSQSVDFFAGRKMDLNRMRGVETVKEIDFYGEE